MEFDQMQADKPKTVFLSYAREDVEFVHELERSLHPLTSEGLISIWLDRRITAGLDWREEVTNQLGNADVIVLLLSSAYLASDYCWGLEMKMALDRHREGHSHLFPVILRPCDWKSTPLAHLQVLPRDGKPVTQWRSRQAAFSEVAESLRSALTRLPQPQASAPQTPAAVSNSSETKPKTWFVPFARDEGFVGRNAELAEIRNELTSSNRETRPLIITGLAGVGKTALAVEFAYRFAGLYSAVWWLRASHEETFAADLSDFARHLGLVNNQQDQRYGYESARRWLAQNRGWLLICDDIGDPSILESVSDVKTGGILGTSRLLSWRRGVELLSLLPLSNSDAGLLLREFGISDQSEQTLLSSQLSGHPLALRLAASCIQSSGERPQVWLGRLKELKVQHEGTASVDAALRYLVSESAVKSRFATPILNICSFLAADPFPVAPLIDFLLPLLSENSIKEDACRELQHALADLVSTSLIGRSGETVTFHPFIQDTVRSMLQGQELELWSTAAVALAVATFPEIGTDPSSWSTCSLLLPHAYSVLNHAEQFTSAVDPSVILLRRIGLYLASKGEFAEAQSSFFKALRFSELSTWRGSVLPALLHQHIGGIHESLGDVQAAADSYTRALTLSAEAHPPDRTATIHLTAALARVLSVQGQTETAERLLRTAANDAVEDSEVDRDLSAQILAQLADTLRQLGRRSEAQDALRRAIFMTNQSVRAKSQLPRYWNSLGVLLGENRDYAEAVQCFERAAIGSEDVGDYAQLASITNNLGRIRLETGKIDEAIRLYEQSLQISQRLGNSQYLGLASRNLGDAYYRKGDFAAANKHLSLALRLLEGAYGPTHPICKQVYEQLALSSDKVGR